MLRVAPLRQPLTTYQSGWEEYSEKPTKDFENGKLFWFNRRTFEALYEEPYEVHCLNLPLPSSTLLNFTFSIIPTAVLTSRQ